MIRQPCKKQSRRVLNSQQELKMEYADIRQAAEQAKSQQELCEINDKTEQLFAVGELRMTDDNWVDYTNLIGERHPNLPAK